MNYLAAYCSTEGQTRKIMRHVARRISFHGNSVELLSASDTDLPAIAIADATILAASVHTGEYQRELRQLAEKHADTLNRRPTLFISVSLSAASEDPAEKAAVEKIAQGFCTSTGLQPRAIKHVAGAFRFSEYDFMKGWAMRYIAMRKGVDVDPQKNTEFTDWADLDRTIDGFIAEVSPVSA